MLFISDLYILYANHILGLKGLKCLPLYDKPISTLRSVTSHIWSHSVT